MEHDAIIVGSGFGGAFAADRLVDAGMRVLLAERGPWRDTAPVRAAGVDSRSPLPHGRYAATRLLRRVSAAWLPAAGLRTSADGLFDVHVGREMTVICSSGVGGGSHVYSSMNTKPASPTFWTEGGAGIDGLDDSTMAPHYESAVRRMGARPPGPGEGVPNAVVDRFPGDGPISAASMPDQPAMGFRFESGTFRSNSYLGSADGAKVTLDELLLIPASHRGLEVADRHEALDFAPLEGGWRLTLRDGSTGRLRHVMAPRLLLAAGTLGTLRLLFAARSRGALGSLPALGRRLSGNGDLVAWLTCNHAGADYSLGPPCHGRFAVRSHGGDLFLVSFGANGIDELPIPMRLRARLKRDLVLVGMGADGANGVATWRGGRLRLRYDLGANPVLARLGGAFREVERNLGGRARFPRRTALTVHPLGGARVAPDPGDGVVDGSGQVHGSPGLYVVDGSALPSAPGTPPSMSIAAWALHVSGRIADQS